jgi:Zn-dependent protease/CBS domain-containing protein
MRGFRLGSIFGFEIRIDYSWFIIFFLILWTFGFGVFPAMYPEQDPGTYIVMALVGTLLFFASLLGHELSHSLVARRKGIPVSGITLFVFGGIAHAGTEFKKPADEFQIAGIGPVSSFVFAGLFYLIAWAGRAADWSLAVIGVASYLAFINLVLAVFNLLPGFPLDGGRLFRSIIWKYTGDLRKATRWSTAGGKVLGYLLIGLGLLNFFAGNLIGGLWSVLIGWFVRSAAETSYIQLVLRQSLGGVRATEVMTPNPYTVPADLTLERFVEEHVFQGRHHAYPAISNGGPVGIITLDQVKQVPRDQWALREVSEAMAPLDDSMVAGPDEGMETVLDRLGESATRRLLVVRNGDLLGIITRSDLARWLERLQVREA